MTAEESVAPKQRLVLASLISSAPGSLFAATHGGGATMRDRIGRSQRRGSVCMGEVLKVTPEHLRQAATAIDTEAATVSGLTVPSPATAITELAGLECSSVLQTAHDHTGAALTVVAKRFTTMASLCRETGDTFELLDLLSAGTAKPEWMSDRVGDGLAAMGDLNATIPAPPP